LPIELVRFAHAYVLLGLARLAVLRLPFRRIARFLGEEDQESLASDLDAAQTESMLAVSRSVRSAANNTPWNSNCLAQTIVATHLLRRAGLASSAHFGVKAPGEILTGPAAHAWVRCGRTFVVGGAERKQFHEVGVFLSRPKYA